MQFDAEPYEDIMNGIHAIYSNSTDAWEYYNNNRGRLEVEYFKEGDPNTVYGGYFLSEPEEWPVLS